MKLQKCQNSRSKKNNSGNDNYKLLIAFVSSVVGFLQNIEQHLLNILDQAELAVVNSINNVIDKLNNSIDVSILLITFQCFILILYSYVITCFSRSYKPN